MASLRHTENKREERLCNQKNSHQTDSEDTHSFDVIRFAFVSVVLTKRAEAVENGDDGGGDKTGDHWRGSDF